MKISYFSDRCICKQEVAKGVKETPGKEINKAKGGTETIMVKKTNVSLYFCF